MGILSVKLKETIENHRNPMENNNISTLVGTVDKLWQNQMWHSPLSSQEENVLFPSGITSPQIQGQICIQELLTLLCNLFVCDKLALLQQNHTKWLRCEGTSGDCVVQTPAIDRIGFSRLFRATFIWVLNISKGRDFTTFLGNL